jgi:dTDP-4-amino-4,6-dideoxygalactose transaminase
LGYNFRLTDFAAALGLSQLDRLDRFISTRNELADVYGELFSNTRVRVPEIDKDIRSSFHLYIVQVQLDLLQKRALFDLMHERGIGLNVHYIPIYRQPFFARMGFSGTEFPAAEMYYSSAISIPMYVELTFSQQKYVVDSLLESLEEVCSQRP